MTGRPRRIAPAELAWTVAWSPDGSRIAFGNVTGDGFPTVEPNGDYFRDGIRHLKAAEEMANVPTLFDALGVETPGRETADVGAGAVE